MKYAFLTMLVVFSALAGYAVLRGCQVLREMPCARNTYLAVMIVLYAFLIGGTVVGMFGTFPMARVIAFIGHTALIFFIYMILLFVLVDVVRLVNLVVHFAPEGMWAFRTWAFYIGMAAIVLVMAVGNIKFNHPKIVEMEVTVEGKPLQGKELKMVVASDIHLGVSITKKRLQRYVELINAQQPDIILLAGDVCDNALAPIVKQQMNEDLRRLQAPLGVYAVPGNHEYIGGDINGAAAYLESGGIRVLRDSAVLVDDSFYLVGRDDRMNPRRKALAELTAPLDVSLPVIMMDHQPYHLEEAEACGVDLQLSGHTHDGQFFPANLIVRSMYENAHGYSTRGRTHYYVSSGLGIWGPQYRIGTQSELVVIRLKY